MVKTVEFGRLQDARQIRNDNLLSQFLADSDSGNEKTVRVVDNIPDRALNRIRGDAADSRQAERDKAGQAALTREERNEIDFSREGVDVPTARSIKGIAENEGVTDWMAYADLTLTVDENREVLASAAQEEGNARQDAEMTEGRQIERAAQANERVEREEIPRAKDAAIAGGDAEAAEFLQTDEFAVAATENDFRGSLTDEGVFSGSGEDFERAVERHRDRSARARALDERKRAEIAPNPVVWSQNPGRYDLPGVDTVQPAKVHERRSERAQQTDENDFAPVADSPVQWARNPDQYDWPGVDLPDASPFPENADQLEAEALESAGGATEAGAPEFGIGGAPGNAPAPASPRDFEPGSADSIQTTRGMVPGGPSGPESPADAGLGSNNDPDVIDPVFYRNDVLDDLETERDAQEQADQAAALGEVFTDDRGGQSDLLDVGLSPDTRQQQGRESSVAEETASAFGVDDRTDAGRGESRDIDEGEQQGFEVFGGGVRENETLF
jgi:hypothetical protein